jgi:V/A-type H+/Na+-transporting ATPase subunit I
MLSTERMKKIEILIMKRDMDSVMRYLGFAGCVQLITESREQKELSEEEREIADLKVRLQSLARFLGIPEDAVVPGTAATAPDRAGLRDQSNAVLDATRALVGEETALLQRRLGLKQAADELSAFSRLKVAFGDMENLTYLTFRLGSVDPAVLGTLTEKLAKRALVLPLDRPGHFIAVAPKKGRWALDSELARHDFKAAQFPAGLKGVPSDMLAAMQADIDEADRQLGDLERRKREYASARSEEIGFLLANLDLNTTIDTVQQALPSTGNVSKVSGWIPARKLDEVTRGLDGLTQGRIALRTYVPEELPEVKSGVVKVPVSMEHDRVSRAFERLVISYSVPLYGTIDPTPFVAVSFLLLFAIMFGDVGQGFIGVLIGLAIGSGRFRSFESYRKKHFGTTFLLAGLASMASGFLYGSVFANEELLAPVTRYVTRLVMGRPIDHLIVLGGFQKIIIFFGVTIGIGALINSLGLILNIVNQVRRRRWGEALLSKTGFAGAFFFWYLLFVIVRVLLMGGAILPLDFLCIALPLLAIFCKELIEALAHGHRPLFKEGAFAFVMSGVAEVLESAIYYVSNSVSFLRVAAFGLAHTVLSSIIFLMADMVAAAPAGMVYKLLVVLVGNAIIIVLEGLIVTIQVVRLHYYEFFSKFYTESGEEFSPFILRTSGGLR